MMKIRRVRCCRCPWLLILYIPQHVTVCDTLNQRVSCNQVLRVSAMCGGPRLGYILDGIVSDFSIRTCLTQISETEVGIQFAQT